MSVKVNAVVDISAKAKILTVEPDGNTIHAASSWCHVDKLGIFELIKSTELVNSDTVFAADDDSKRWVMRVPAAEWSRSYEHSDISKEPVWILVNLEMVEDHEDGAAEIIMPSVSAGDTVTIINNPVNGAWIDAEAADGKILISSSSTHNIGVVNLGVRIEHKECYTPQAYADMKHFINANPASADIDELIQADGERFKELLNSPMYMREVISKSDAVNSDELLKLICESPSVDAVIDVLVQTDAGYDAILASENALRAVTRNHAAIDAVIERGLDKVVANPLARKVLYPSEDFMTAAAAKDAHTIMESPDSLFDICRIESAVRILKDAGNTFDIPITISKLGSQHWRLIKHQEGKFENVNSSNADDGVQLVDVGTTRGMTVAMFLGEGLTFGIYYDDGTSAATIAPMQMFAGFGDLKYKVISPTTGGANGSYVAEYMIREEE